jgi:hypothetical protein
MAAVALPGEMRRFMHKAQRGELEMRFGNVEEATKQITAVGRQVIYTAIGIAAAAFAMVFEGRGQGGAAENAWRVATVAGVVLALSMWSNRKKR